MARKKTKKMLEIEQRFNREISELVVELVTEHGQTETAEMVGVSKALVWHWIALFGVEIRRVALAPGDELKIEHGYLQGSRERDRAATKVPVTRLEDYQARKLTEKMLAVERRFDCELSELLVELVTENGQTDTAALIGIGTGLLSYWLIRSGIVVKQVAIGREDTLIIERAYLKKRCATGEPPEAAEVALLADYRSRKAV